MFATPARDPGTSDGRCAALLASRPPDGGSLRLAVRRRLALRGDQGVSWKVRVALWSAALFAVLFWLFLVIGRRL